MEETDEYKQFLEEREIYRKTCRVSDEKIKKLEIEIDESGLEIPIKIKGNIIKTFGELRKYATSTKNVRKMEPYLSDSDFSYIFNWILRKEIKNGIFVKDNSDYIN
jgi:hypothetical protein